MSYAGNTSDVEQEKSLTDSFRRNRSSQSLVSKTVGSPKNMSEVIWNDKRDKSEDSDSEISDSGNFLAKGKLFEKFFIFVFIACNLIK